MPWKIIVAWERLGQVDQEKDDGEDKLPWRRDIQPGSCIPGTRAKKLALCTPASSVQENFPKTSRRFVLLAVKGRIPMSPVFPDSIRLFFYRDSSRRRPSYRPDQYTPGLQTPDSRKFRCFCGDEVYAHMLPGSETVRRRRRFLQASQASLVFTRHD
jgi:hypothetical protein